MCGITGFINETDNKKATLNKMMNKIKHRGPDENGYYIDDDAAIGHLRLSIVDLKNGQQPMLSSDKNLVISFNGEIYNYLDIKKDLIEKGYKFRTNSDTEVLLNGYHCYNKNILNKLRGMFSFVIWDKKEKILFGARDFFGIKPLYYYKTKETFMFASEIKSFLVNNEFIPELNKKVLPNYLNFGFNPTNETFFKNVYSLKPGFYFIYKNKKLELKKYFDVTFDEKDNSLNFYSDKIEKVVKDSVECHKSREVEMGTFLSGGIDSSVITYLSKPKHTYTIGYKNKKYDESVYAKEFAKEIKVGNKTVYVNKNQYMKNLDKAIYHMDEPVADPSIVSLYLVAKEAKKHVKVILSGEGSDEFFGGYNTYSQFQNFKFYNKIPYFIRNIISKICKLLPSNIKGVDFLIRRGEKLENEYIGVNRLFSDKECKKLLNEKYDSIRNKDLTKEFFEKSKNNSIVTQMQMIDINFWLIQDILLKADKMSMASSIEGRVPLVDIEVFKVARDLPEYTKVDNSNTKIAFRKAFENLLGEHYCNRKKLGFPVPLRDWIKNEDVNSMIKEEFNSEFAINIFNNKKLNKLLNQICSGKNDDYKKIWSIYVFLRWYKIFFEK